MRHNREMASRNIPLTRETMIDHYRDSLPTGGQPFPHAERIGLRLREVEPGRAVVELDCGAEHWNTVGTVHGGVFCSVADTAMGIAHGSLLHKGERGTTVDLQINFLRPVIEGLIHAEARVVKHGRTISLVECEVRDSSGALVARASSNCMTLSPRRSPEE